MLRTVVLLLSIGVFLLSAGCSRFAHHAPTTYVTIVGDGNRDPDKARALCDRAGEFFEAGRIAKAEAALQDALIADVSYAPAHNNLGRIYFDQGKLYLAAWEFEYARRLLPESAEVNNNLGLVYEAAGQLDQAIDCYRAAVSMDSGNIEYKGNLARTLIRAGKEFDQAAALLKDIVLHDSRPAWVQWARQQLELNEPIRTAAQESSQQQEVGGKMEPFEPLPPPYHIDDLGPPETPDSPRMPDHPPPQ